MSQRGPGAFLPTTGSSSVGFRNASVGLPGHVGGASRGLPEPFPAPSARLRPGPGVRIHAADLRFSTDLGKISPPQPGDREVVHIASTGATADTPSGQVKGLGICGQQRSTACGQNIRPQGPFDVVHRRPTGGAALSPASPHPCPLFGNTTPAFTARSERRHTKGRGWAVGNLGKTGDSPGEKHHCPVHGVCRTFACPQKRRVVHRCHPQDQWIKNRA